MDRDDDLGVKAGIRGPVIGEEANLEAAAKLATADPEDSDANTIFAAVKTARELRKQGYDVEVATVTGSRNLGFVADSNVNSQLKMIFEEFPADGVVFVTDGAEDDQVVPIILSYAPIISKKTVIVKQAVQLERTYYVLKNAIRDKDIAAILFGVPGTAFILWAILGDLAIKLIFGLIGAYFVAIATGLDTAIADWVRTIVRGISLRGPGAPFYLISLALLVLAAYSGYQNIIALPQPTGTYEAIRSVTGFTSISAILYLFGRMLDAHRNRKAFLIGKYVRYTAVVVVFWAIVDATMRILEGNSTITDLYAISFAGVLFYVIIAQIGAIFEESIKTSKKIVGVDAFSKNGARIGKVKAVDPENGEIIIETAKRELKVLVDRVSVTAQGVVVGA